MKINNKDLQIKVYSHRRILAAEHCGWPDDHRIADEQSSSLVDLLHFTLHSGLSDHQNVDQELAQKTNDSNSGQDFMKIILANCPMLFGQILFEELKS